MVILKLYVLLVTITIEVQAADRGESCTTPNLESAKCLTLTSCPVIKNAILTRNQTAIEFAKESQCGYDTEPLVCCGSTGYPEETSLISIFTRPASTTTTTTTTGKPNIDLNFISSNSLPDRSLCGIERETPRLTGASVAGIDEYPWMALIKYKDNNGVDAGFKCGGTLINNRYVLTAAHCIFTEPEPFKPDSVRLGEWKISTTEDCVVHNSAIEDCSDPVIDLKIKEEIAHPYYSARSGNNDIALLLLNEDVNYTDFIRPICLPPINLPPPSAGVRMTVCGWGATEDGSPSDIKLKLQVPVVTNVECKEKVSRFTAISANQICAGGEEGKDACKGDSGGPLMRTYTDSVSPQWYQEGIVSRGRGCGRKGYPGVYTRVSRYINWILSNISNE